MKYCTKCGYQLNDEATYCPNCGENLGDNNSNNQQNNNPYNNYNSNAQAASPIWGILALVFGILGGWLALVFGIIGLTQYKNPADPGYNSNRKMCKVGIGLFIAWVVIIILLIIIVAAAGVSAIE